VTTKYRCYLLHVDRVAAVCLIECANDRAAIIEAKQILASTPCTTVEVWDSARKVSIVCQSGLAA
jgi:hypothetical protein